MFDTIMSELHTGSSPIGILLFLGILFFLADEESFRGAAFGGFLTLLFFVFPPTRHFFIAHPNWTYFILAVMAVPVMIIGYRRAKVRDVRRSSHKEKDNIRAELDHWLSIASPLCTKYKRTDDTITLKIRFVRPDSDMSVDKDDPSSEWRGLTSK